MAKSLKRSQAFKRLWKDPKYRKKMLAKRRQVNSSAKYRKNMSRVMSKVCQRAEVKAQRSEEMKRRYENPEVRIRQSKEVKERWSDPEYYERVVKNMQAAWTPEKRKQLSKSHKICMPKCAHKISATMLEQFRNGRQPTGGRPGDYEQGWIDSEKSGEVFYRSSWERLFIELLDSSKLVKSFKYQPFRIQYKYKGKVRTYLPDFLVKMWDGRKILVELKSPRFIDSPKEKKKFVAGEMFCEARGMDYQVLSQKPIKPLSRYLQ